MSTETTAPLEKQGLALDTGRRRSMRVLLSVPIHVSGKDRKDRPFDEDTRTLVVNAHGALISLAAAVIAGQQITVANQATEQSRDCRVVYLGSGASGKIQMGIEFVKPSPKFWQIDFPPDKVGSEHDERESRQEEVYLTLSGGGTLEIDGETTEMKPGRYVLVSPESKRRPAAGPDGMSFLVIGGVPDGVYEPSTPPDE